MLDHTFYRDREQTFVKHFTLEHHLEKLAYKIGWYGTGINYVDGFAGPWRHADQNLRDTSPFIALDKLAACRASLISHGRKPIDVGCLFVERSRTAFSLLDQETRLASSPGVVATARNGEFEDLIPEVARFASYGGRFAFFFIDPTGWTGYGMSKLRPLFEHRRSEVLINFMTKDIKRFVDDDHPSTLTTFTDLYGGSVVRQEWRGLTGLEREDRIVATYCKRISEVGRYPYVGASVVLHPTDSRTHYHLIYGTRHHEGLRVFRGVERMALSAQQKIRSEAQQRSRIQRSGQGELFQADDHTGYLVELRNRYHSLCQARLLRLFAERRRLNYDDVELLALRYPMTSVADLRDWVAYWKVCNGLVIDGLKGRARSPRFGLGHKLIWRS